MFRSICRFCISLTAIFAVSGLICGAFAGSARAYDLPLKVSADHRSLVDQNNVPFMIVGDAPQALVGNLSPADADFFMADRETYGINTLWVNLLCDSYTACNSDGTTFDGIAPFTTAGDLATPNAQYFNRVAKMVTLAASHGMVLLLDPIETGGWLGVLQANGAAKARAYGRFLGRRFRGHKNIIWMSGNDFQSWRTAADDAVVSAVAKGIHDTDPDALQTVELDYLVSASLDDPTWRPIVGLDAVYTYRPTYAKALQEYRRVHFKPTFMVEANYEFEQNGGTDGGSTQNLRRQEYWSALSGTTGQLYASQYSWRLDGAWKTNLDTVGILQFSYMRQLFQPRAWYDLVPDRDHQLVQKGVGHFSTTDSIDTDTYATAAITPDGTLAIAYLPSIRKITIDMAKLAGPVTAKWFDPTSNAFTAVTGSPFANSGSRDFKPPGTNTAGDGDWVLVLTAG